MTTESGDKRRQILTAATKAFAAHGFHQAKIADIAAAAGVGKGTVYEYFSSKRDLFRQLLEHTFNAYLEFLEKISQEEMKLEPFLRRLLKGSLGYFWEQREIVRVILNDPPPVDNKTQALIYQARENIMERLGSYFLAAIDQGEMRPLSPRLLAAMLTGLTAAISHQLLDADWELDLEDTIDEIIEFMMHGVAVKPE